MLNVDDTWALTLRSCVDDIAEFFEQRSDILLVRWVGGSVAPERGVAEAELVVNEEEGCCVGSGDGRDRSSLG